MTRDEAQKALSADIIAALTAFPDLAGLATISIQTGQMRAYQQLLEQYNHTRMALSMALAIMPPNRLTETAKKSMEIAIANMLPPEKTRCRAESHFAERIKEALTQQTEETQS
ncbi:MAG: hypothetical protein RLZZ157_86 [Pseudomonadota bacterium]|jgi:hypothetical protein